MAKETQERLPDSLSYQLLKELEKEGREKWLKRWREHMALPSSLSESMNKREIQEEILRYLLLRILLNQQARVEKVKELSISLYGEFSEKLSYEPFNIYESKLFSIFKEIGGAKGSLVYKVGALGGIKPLSLFAYRFKAYEGFIRWLNEENLKFYDLIHDFILEQGVKELFRFLSSHPVLEAGWVGNDPKACRMFVNWVVFLFGEIFGFEEVRLEDTLMIVDGHVGKVFCRTGLLGEVLYEKKRPYIIQASKMRSVIEQIVSKAGLIPFYVDNGAFYLYEYGYCKDLEPHCEACPVQGICKRYIKWTAYQIFRQS
jgi:hypothetical protein